MGKMKDFLKKRKKLILGVLAVATCTGTLMGNKGGFPPIYTRKGGDSYGINVGLVTQFDEGARHYGVNLSAYNYMEGGEINGIILNVGNELRGGEIRGINLHFAGGTNMLPNPEKIKEIKVTGLELGLLNMDAAGKTIMNGIQIGILNINGGGRNAQFGVYNRAGKIEGRFNWGIGYNIYEDAEREKPSPSSN